MLNKTIKRDTVQTQTMLGSGSYGLVRKRKRKVTQVVKWLQKLQSNWNELLICQYMKRACNETDFPLYSGLVLSKDENKLGIVYPRLDEDLWQWKRHHKHVEWATIKPIISQLLCKCAKLIQHGIYHLDVKLNNLMFDYAAKQVHIIDYGLATFTWNRKGEPTSNAQSTSYRSPEIALWYEYGMIPPQMEPCVVWSLGMTCYRLMSSFHSLAHFDRNKDLLLFWNHGKPYTKDTWLTKWSKTKHLLDGTYAPTLSLTTCPKESHELLAGMLTWKETARWTLSKCLAYLHVDFVPKEIQPKSFECKTPNLEQVLNIADWDRCYVLLQGAYIHPLTMSWYICVLEWLYQHPSKLWVKEDTRGYMLHPLRRLAWQIALTCCPTRNVFVPETKSELEFSRLWKRLDDDIRITFAFPSLLEWCRRRIVVFPTTKEEWMSFMEKHEPRTFTTMRTLLSQYMMEKVTQEAEQFWLPKERQNWQKWFTEWKQKKTHNHYSTVWNQAALLTVLCVCKNSTPKDYTSLCRSTTNDRNNLFSKYFHYSLRWMLEEMYGLRYPSCKSSCGVLLEWSRTEFLWLG